MLEGAQTLEFASRTPRDYAQMLAGNDGEPVRLQGYLTLPTDRNGSLPLLIISIGSAGLSAGREAFYSKVLSQAGWAVLVVDSFGGRGFSETASDQGRLPIAASAADALYALRFAAGDGRFDPARTAILGFSRGGHVSLATHDERLQRAVAGEARFCAHVALYPSWNPRWRHPRPSKAPILMLLGEADELAPLAKAQAYLAQLERAGALVESVVFQGAHHGFDQVRPATRNETHTNLSDCEMFIEDDGAIVEDRTGLVAQDWPLFLRTLAARRERAGATLGYGPQSREVALPHILRFFQPHLLTG